MAPGRGGEAVPGERVERVAQAALRVEARVRHGDCVHDQRVPAEAVDLEADAREEVAVLVERLALDQGEAIGDRVEGQRLRHAASPRSLR